jgi:hypothetical protein
MSSSYSSLEFISAISSGKLLRYCRYVFCSILRYILSISFFFARANSLILVSCPASPSSPVD